MRWCAKLCMMSKLDQAREMKRPFILRTISKKNAIGTSLNSRLSETCFFFLLFGGRSGRVVARDESRLPARPRLRR